VNKGTEGGGSSGGFRGTTLKPPVIVIAPRTIIKGTLRFEREVKLYVSDQATVGPIEGAGP